MSIFDGFVKKHEYLICVDSDGCVMDTMNCKHFHCFGPCLVHEWVLEQWQDEILRRWNDINLFQMTRGINRFKGLSMALTEINARYTPIIGIQGLQHWVDTAPALSNDSLVDAIDACEDDDVRLCLHKALVWSLAVNESINRLPEELKKPYDGARECLAACHEFADIAMVSSANRDALEEEWENFGLLQHTDILLAQDVGNKSFCIAKLIEFGYDPEKVMMVGDAPGDCDAAESNGIWFFPILVNWEEESWEELHYGALDLFVSGSYGSVQDEKKQVFVENLGGY